MEPSKNYSIPFVDHFAISQLTLRKQRKRKQIRKQYINRILNQVRSQIKSTIDSSNIHQQYPALKSLQEIYMNTSQDQFLEQILAYVLNFPNEKFFCVSNPILNKIFTILFYGEKWRQRILNIIVHISNLKYQNATEKLFGEIRFKPARWKSLLQTTQNYKLAIIIFGNTIIQLKQIDIKHFYLHEILLRYEESQHLNDYLIWLIQTVLVFDISLHFNTEQIFIIVRILKESEPGLLYRRKDFVFYILNTLLKGHENTKDIIKILEMIWSHKKFIIIEEDWLNVFQCINSQVVSLQNLLYQSPQICEMLLSPLKYQFLFERQTILAHKILETITVLLNGRFKLEQLILESILNRLDFSNILSVEFKMRWIYFITSILNNLNHSKHFNLQVQRILKAVSDQPKIIENQIEYILTIVGN